jgi:hypothetical protein
MLEQKIYNFDEVKSMEKDTNIILRVNSQLKENVAALAKKYDVSLSELINACLVELDRKQSIPLNICRHLPNRFVEEKKKVTIALIKCCLELAIRNSKKQNLIKKGYLFGSYARGEETKKSDIDIRLEADRGLTLIDVGNIRQDISEATGKDVDLLVVKPENMDPAFYENIRKDEICIYER